MNNIQVAIIEDEKPAARLLEGMIKKLRPQWDIIKIPGSIESSVAWFASHPHPDIVFLDIQLSDGNSFLFIEQACPTSLIIFTTAYDEYAVRAFTVNTWMNSSIPSPAAFCKADSITSIIVLSK